MTVRLGEHEIIGVTVVNAKWLAERDGRIVISIPEPATAQRLETSARDLAPALGG